MLDLSGDCAAAVLQTMVTGSEDHGGIERYIDAVKLKSAMFQQALVDNPVDELDLEASRACAPSWRPCAAASVWLNEDAFADMREGIVDLFDDGGTSTIASAVSARFPEDKKHRWVRISPQSCCTTPTPSACR